MKFVFGQIEEKLSRHMNYCLDWIFNGHFT